MLRVCLICVVFVCEAVCMHSSKAMEGYPAGYLADCEYLIDVLGKMSSSQFI